jgi:dihydropyrimidinase
VTCRDAADAIIAARARGVPAYGETCLQYLLLTEDDLKRPDFEGARYVCSPPLRTPDDQAALWTALAYDHLQIVSTDHCPFDDAQKRLGLHDFSKIPNGLAVIQHRLAMLWEHGVRTGRLTPSRLVEITSSSVAKLFGLYPQKGTIAPGADADIVIYDPGATQVMSAETHHMNVDYSAYEGRTVTGRVQTVLSRGEVVIDDRSYTGRAGHGRFVARETCRYLG